MQKSIKLLYDLGRDADLAAEFSHEPGSVMGRYGFGGDGRRALR